MPPAPRLSVLRSALLLSALLLAAPPGAAAPARAADCPDGFDQVMSSPKRLFQRAANAVQDGDLEGAYRYASLVRRLHPDSPEADEAFLLATRVFRPLWRYKRLDQPNSLWATAEPVFLFQWATEYFEDEGDVFPQKQMDAFLRKMPKTYSVLWLQYVDRLYGEGGVKQWDFEFDYDNGLVDAVRGVRARPAAASVSQR